MGKPTLIIIAGPSSVGKTNICIQLAEHFKTEIINCDSRQMFREMPVGSGCPDEEQLKKVKHHFIGNLSIHDYYNAGRYEEDVLKLLGELFINYQVIIVSAGSGLYLDAITQGIDFMPEFNAGIREQLNARFAEYGHEAMLNELKQVDEQYYNQVDRNNIQRVLRGLEVFYLTGRPYSEFRVKNHKVRDFGMIKICLQRERDELYQRIDARVDAMISKGLETEARYLYQFKNLVAAKTIGYREWFPYFDGLIAKDESIRLIKRNTRHLARRQITWFKSKKDFVGMDADNFNEILRYISKFKFDEL